MRGLARQAGRRLGYRGAALLIAGVAWINYGVGLLADPRFGTARGATALVSIAPLAWWGWVWIVTGVASCAASVLRSAKDWWGWVCAAAMPAIWAVAYTGARMLGEFPQGWYSGVTWAAFPGLLAVLAAATRRLVLLHREVAKLRSVAPCARGAEHAE
ncbi:hypothetical protein PUR59_04095 [Streptomyces sp. SP18ES09]|uniref:hypothetical protein n=1 Tax=Streptomyces sp. SP18ES09 TaxID=3002532 RepID=UPI002E785E80|nr:hypothetical protein [Streptomyces sp. SP18ES09]MEE1814201.1 hypothetical protein [Streptomyces sp. SP18ES09]